jgi:hypothetical protein
MPSGVEQVRRALNFFLWVIWFGGLTFYAAIVVPVGTDAIGATGQGFITQQVTIRLNIAATLLLACWLWDLIKREQRTRRAWVVWSIHVGLLLALFLLHWKLTSVLDFDDRSVPEDGVFYQWHRAYLLVTTVQWVLGIVMGLEFLAVVAKQSVASRNS